MELNFNDLRSKDMINVYDGKILGRAVDIVFDKDTSEVRGFYIPLIKKGFSLKKPESIFVNIKSIIRIGEDVILIDLRPKGQEFQGINNNRLVPKTFKLAKKSKISN